MYKIKMSKSLLVHHDINPQEFAAQIISYTGGNLSLSPGVSNSIISINTTQNGGAIFLPPVQAGLNFKFVCAQNDPGEVCIVRSPLHGKVYLGTAGNCLQTDGTAVGDVDFVHSKIGDTLNITSDGINYYFNGYSAASNGFIFNDW
jgi:hypothetical protein